MSEQQARRLAETLTEKQKEQLLLVVRMMGEAAQAKAVST